MIDLTTNERRPLLLGVDASSLIFRAFYALPELNAPDGEPVQGVLGFLNMLMRAVDDLRPQRLAVVYDGGSTGREEVFSDYKGHRPEVPDPLARQFEHVAELLDALEMPVLFKEGVEADDMLGRLAREAEALGHRVAILTGDKDLLQLASHHTTILFTRRGVTRLDEIDRRAFQAEYGFDPELFPDYKALIGDTADNIPGVRGIGPKTAAQLVREHGGLESILAAAHAGRVGGAAGTALRNHEADARLSLALTTLRTGFPYNIDLDALRFSYAAGDNREVQGLLRSLGLNRLAERLSAKAHAAAAAVRDAGDAGNSGPGGDQPPGVRAGAADVKRYVEGLRRSNNPKPSP